jgi:segregation and condensation protein B
MDQALITRIVEAALLAANQPLTLAQLHGLFPEEQPAPSGSVEQALEQLREACAERGVDLVEVASGFRYQVKEEVHGWVARLWTERKTKYTRATLETLALIAYRQPITRGEIEAVRGVAVSSNTIQALEEREWIRVVGHRDVPGRPALFGTTKIFLDYFGLKRLEDLPPLSELKDIGELEPQLFMDDAPVPAGLPAAVAGIDNDAAEEQQAPQDSDEESDEEESDEQDSGEKQEYEQATDANDAPEDSLEAIPSQHHDDTEGTDPDRQASSEQKQ